MTEIVETLHQYVSGHGDHLFKILMNPIFSSYSLLQIIPSGTMWRRLVNCSKRTSDVQLLIYCMQCFLLICCCQDQLIFFNQAYTNVKGKLIMNFSTTGTQTCHYCVECTTSVHKICTYGGQVHVQLLENYLLYTSLDVHHKTDLTIHDAYNVRDIHEL